MTARRLKLFGSLDRYVARLFAMSYLSAFFLVVGVFLILDMATNLDEYLEPGPGGETPVAMVVRYYAYQMPFLYLQVSPFVTLVAGLFVGVRMTKANEVVAALGAGVSGQRLFAPLLAGALLLALGMFSMREWATSSLGQRRDALHDRLAEGRESPVLEDFWVRDAFGHALRVEEYHPGVEGGGKGEATILDLSSARLLSDDTSILLTADRATWSPEKQQWSLTGGRLMEFGARKKRQSEVSGFTDLGITPSDVALAWKGREQPLECSFSECLRLLEREPRNARYRTLFHYHLSFPLAGIVLLAVGLPFVVGQERGRAHDRVAMGLVLCVFYFGLDFAARTLGMAG